MRRAYDTWGEGRKKQRPTTAKNLDPTLKSACSKGQLTRKDNTDRSALRFLAAEALPPNNWGGRAGSKSKSQQPYDKDGLLTTTRRTRNSARPASLLFCFEPLSNVLYVSSVWLEQSASTGRKCLHRKATWDINCPGIREDLSQPTCASKFK